MNSNSLLDIVNEFELNDMYDEEPCIYHPSPYFEIEQFTDILNNNEKSFALLSLNSQSLHAKLEQLKVYLHMVTNANSQIHVICLQETWINENSDLQQFNIPGYNFISKSATCSSHGGVAMYIKDDINYKILEINGNPILWDGLFIEISISNYQEIEQRVVSPKKIIIGNIY